MDPTTEQVIMTIISSAGDSKAKAFDAMKKVKEGDYNGARQLLKEAQEADLEAHEAQTKLIQEELSGEGTRPELSLLMVHAQDHYMTAQLARDMVESLIDVFEAKEGK